MTHLLYHPLAISLCLLVQAVLLGDYAGALTTIRSWIAK